MGTIRDFGEKIGGARKDDPPAPRKKRDPKPPLPDGAVGFGEGWRKRYWIQEVEKGYVVRDLLVRDRHGDPRRTGLYGMDRAAAERHAGVAEANRVFQLRMFRRGPDKGVIYLSQKSEGGKPIFDRSRRRTFTSLQEARGFMRSDEIIAMLDDLPRNYGEKDMTEGFKPCGRTGPVRRDGDATPEDILREFNIRGCEFGNWVSAKGERQRLLNGTYDAFCDLAEVLGIPRSAIGLEGELSLSFGSRGAGGWASATYHPDRAVINLTRTKGGGWIAHEWAHALDHFLRRKTRKAPGRDVEGVFAKGEGFYLSETASGYNLETAVNLYPDFRAEASWLDRFRKRDRYWSAPVEIFARLFNTYVADTCRSRCILNEFLTIPCLNKGDGFRPFPEGDEREKCLEGVETFLGRLREHKLLV